MVHFRTTVGIEHTCQYLENQARQSNRYYYYYYYIRLMAFFPEQPG